MPTLAITYLFSHGIAATQTQAYGYTKKDSTNPRPSHHIIDNEDHELVTFNYPDAYEGWLFDINIKKLSMRINRYETSFAQKNEIDVLNQTHSTIEPAADIVCVGVSRGASALITWLGTHPDKNNVRALILESPFDSMESIMRNMMGEFLYQYPAARSFAHNLIRFIFSQYKKRATTPLQATEKNTLDIPTLIICSAEDTRVPASSSEKLYEKRRSLGHNNVHFVKLARGAHGKLIQGPEGATYRNAVHAFYKKYNLPHNPEYAALGKDLLDSGQHSC